MLQMVASKGKKWYDEATKTEGVMAMTDMTIGQRIAQRRKMLGLSQEAFGEKMGVSRQAISKWEADGAIPEIDKLITMSKLFGVTVGWLLGTEEEPSKTQAEAFTDDQLKLVEEIVKRYQPKGISTKKKMQIAGVVAAVLFLVFMNIGSYVNSQVNGIHNQIGNLYNYYDAIYGQMYTVSQRLDELAAGERLLREYSFTAVGTQDLSGAIVTFAATPREIRPGDQAWLCVRFGSEEVAKVQCTTDGTVYSASVELPAVNGYSYYYQVIHSDGESSLEPLTKENGCDQLATNLRGYFIADFSGTYTGYDSIEMKYLYLFYMEPKLLATEEAQIRDLTLVVSYDGAEQLRIPVIVDGLAMEEGEYVKRLVVSTDFHITLHCQVPMPWVEGRETVLSVEAKLATGNTLSQPLMKWNYGKTEVQFERIAPLA